MKAAIILLSIAVTVAITGCQKQPASATMMSSAGTKNEVVAGPFTREELAQFVALNPIDTHTHFYQSSPAFMAMLQRLNLHVVDILVTHSPNQKELDTEKQRALDFVHSSGGRAILCTTFNPFPYSKPGFAKKNAGSINKDFAHGAIAVKIWKNIGEQVKDANGHYVMPDDPVFEPIYQDIAAHNKTLIAHVADPNTIWEAPNPQAADYSYYTEHPEWYMYHRPNAPSKEAILVARDRVLEKNPKLRVVGAHLGSMEADFAQLAQHLDQYPNFAVDIAARMPYLLMQPRADVISFINKYQDRLIYATDNGLAVNADANEVAQRLEKSYAFDWRFFATNDTLEYKGHTIQGLELPLPVLQKLYHQNAAKWLPGVFPESHSM